MLWLSFSVGFDVEVVSNGIPGDQGTHDRDYVGKLEEYAERGIPKYWLVDPERQVVLVLILSEQCYKEKRFIGADVILSPTFPGISLTVEKILKAR